MLDGSVMGSRMMSTASDLASGMAVAAQRRRNPALWPHCCSAHLPGRALSLRLLLVSLLIGYVVFFVAICVIGFLQLFV